MKHKTNIFFGILILLILSSCNQNFFKKVKIKATPDLRVNLGEKEVKVEDVIKKEDIQKTIQNLGKDLNQIKIYDYTLKEDKNKVIHYLLHYPISEKKVDMSDYINQMDVLPEEKTINISEQNIQIPEITITSTKNLGISIPNNPLASDVELPPTIKNITIPNFETNITSSVTNFKTATISKGTLSVSIQAHPNSLPEGITIDYTGLNITKNSNSFGKFENGNNNTGTMKLENKTISSGEKIKIGGTLKISGTVPKNYGGSSELQLKILGHIDGFSEITIKQKLDIEYSLIHNLENDLKNFVEWIEFKNISADMTLTNNLPQGNDIGITLKSEAFDINNSHNFQSSKTEKHTLFKKSSYRLETDKHSKLDFKASLKPSGYDNSTSGNETLTIKNIEPGKEYLLKGQADIKFEWEKILIKPKGSNKIGIKDKYPETPIKLNIFNENKFLSKIAPKEIAAYIFLNSDLTEKDDKPKLLADIKLEYKPKGQTSVSSIGIIEENNKEVNFTNTPDLSQDTASETISTASMSKNNIDLKDFFQKEAESIQFAVNFNLNEIIIPKTKMEEIKQKPDKSAVFNTDVVLDIPFDITVRETINENILSIEDILSRNTNSYKDLNKLMDTTRELKLVIKYNNKTGLILLGEALNPNWLDKDGNPKFKKLLEIKQGEGEINIKITKDEIDEIKKQNPFKVDINLILNKSNQKLHKGGNLKFKTYIIIGTHIEQEL